MKINELMIGNWVIAPNLIGELREVKVITIKKPPLTDGGYIVDNYGNVTFIKTLAPIPVTEEFLKANGFTRECIIRPDDYYPEGLYEWRKDIDDYSFEVKYEKQSPWSIYIFNANRDSIAGIDIQYVHQLQNVLNILGIEMEVVV